MKFFFGILTMMIFNCGMSLENMREVAKRKSLQKDAPIFAEETILINAPIDKIWKIYNKPKEWVNWNPEVKKVEIENEILVGTKLRWNNG
jgi:uncharacterized membrane protein